MTYLFFSINPPKEIKEKISILLNRFSYLPKTNPNNFHITLKYIGEFKDTDKLISIASVIKYHKFKVSLSFFGAFPSQYFPKVLWLGVEKGKDEIIELASKIDEKTKNIRKDDHDFVPHLTIARLKYKINKDIFSFKFEPFQFEVDSFYLMDSKRTYTGPIYSIIKRFKLQ